MFPLFVWQQHSFYELIINKARGKSGPVILVLFGHMDIMYVQLKYIVCSIAFFLDFWVKKILMCN